MSIEFLEQAPLILLSEGSMQNWVVLMQSPVLKCCWGLPKSPTSLWVNFKLSPSHLTRLADRKTGADVGHPAPGVIDQPSVAALVASYDLQAMKYNSYTTIQPPRFEPIDQLKYMVYVSVFSDYRDS